MWVRYCAGCWDIDINEKETASSIKDPLTQMSVHRHMYVYLRGKSLLLPSDSPISASEMVPVLIEAIKQIKVLALAY